MSRFLNFSTINTLDQMFLYGKGLSCTMWGYSGASPASSYQLPTASLLAPLPAVLTIKNVFRLCKRSPWGDKNAPVRNHSSPVYWLKRG